MSNVVIIDSVRTAIGKLGGALENVPADFLAAAVLDEVIKRADIPKESIDEVIMGQAKQSSDASNLARVASLRAGFPVEVQVIPYTDNADPASRQSILPVNKYKAD